MLEERILNDFTEFLLREHINSTSSYKAYVKGAFRCANTTIESAARHGRLLRVVEDYVSGRYGLTEPHYHTGALKFIEFLHTLPNDYYTLRNTYPVPDTLEPGRPYHDDERGFYPVFYEEGTRREEKIPGLIHATNMMVEHTLFHDLIRQFLREARWEGNYDVPFIPIILSRKTPRDKSYPLSVEWQLAKIQELNERYNEYRGGDRYYEELEEILRTKEISQVKLGAYFHKGSPYDNYYRFPNGDAPYIEIYYRNFRTNDIGKYLAILAQVVAHELFHFAHDVYATRTFNRRFALYRTDVVEGTADYFANTILKEYRERECEELAEKRYNSWKKYLGSGWPYANALHFYYEDNILEPFHVLGNIDKFVQTIHESYYKMSDAYIVMTNHH